MHFAGTRFQPHCNALRYSRILPSTFTTGGGWTLANQSSLATRAASLTFTVAWTRNGFQLCTCTLRRVVVTLLMLQSMLPTLPPVFKAAAAVAATVAVNWYRQEATQLHLYILAKQIRGMVRRMRRMCLQVRWSEWLPVCDRARQLCGGWRKGTERLIIQIGTQKKVADIASRQMHKKTKQNKKQNIITHKHLRVHFSCSCCCFFFVFF